MASSSNSSAPEIMVSTSSSLSIPKSFKYDVFLSFRGEDTRKNFVGHLYQALEAKGIVTYKDDEKIQQGERINDQLLKSIQESRFFIIVFSKTYASSSWCLDELVKIMDCQKMMEHTAFPVFYDVEPTEVRKQNGPVGEAFSKHENQEAAGKWRDAMKELADLAGWELKATANGDESKLIQMIVDAIFIKKNSTLSNADGKLVGMETRISDVLSSLEIGTEDVRMIGIKGMGGGGKTTLARAVYDQISNHFEGISFVENVREVSQPSLSGLKMLQEQILRDVFIDRNISISGVSDGKRMMIQMMLRKKVLVVLDDVDCIGQLEALAGEPNWFKSGSRIIITTRDEQVLLAHRVNFVHDVNLLSQEEAICLFSRYAFRKEVPIQGYEELSGQVVEYAEGLPLTIKVLGSLLCAKLDKREWVDVIKTLKEIPLQETMEKLELSYMSLEYHYKEMFLDIACILKGKRIENAIRVLECCGFHARYGLKVLEQRSLITISFKYGELVLDMHDSIEEMGKNIVRREHPNEPNKHSRLWIKEEIEDILANDMGTEATRCLKLTESNKNARIVMKGLGKMKNLRYLDVNFAYCDDYDFATRCLNLNKSRCLNDTRQYFPNSLKYLRCWKYPFLYLPKTFKANNLVGLEMEGSKRMVQLWKERKKKVLTKLKFLSVNWSKLTTFDFGMTPNLETLSLECSFNTSIKELCMPVTCQKLKHLDINPSKLRTFDLGLTPNLERLSLKNSYNLVELCVPVTCQKLKHLEISHSKLKLRSFDLGLTPNLETLSLSDCADFVELIVPVEYPNLKFLNLSESRLRSLDLELIPNLESLDLNNCSDFEELHVSAACPNLKSLDLRNSRLRSLDLELIPNLERLNLSGCNKLVEFKAPDGCLNNVVYLSLYSCLRFTHFVFDIRSEPKVSSSSANLHLVGKFLDSCPLHPNSNLPKLQFDGCYVADLPSSVGNIEKLLSFGLCACTDFKKFSDIICSLQCLKELTLECDIPEFPKNLGQLECLEELSLRSKEIKHLPDSICMLKRLKSLEVNIVDNYFESLPEDLLEKLPEDLGQLECLEKLCVSSRKIEYLPDSICMLKRLKWLDITGCCRLGKLPEDIGRLKSLKRLYLWGSMIRDLPDSICMLKHLKYLDLDHCALLEKLPEDLGRLECLEQLDITDTGISHLPQSIFGLKGLCIAASSEVLQSYDFPSEIYTMTGSIRKRQQDAFRHHSQV